MGRKSSADRLPPQLKKELDRRVHDPRLTQAQIAEEMRAIGAELSESAVQRYQARTRKLAQQLKLARETAVAIGRELTDVEGDTARLNVEMLQSFVLDAGMSIEPNTDEGAERIEAMARALKNIAVARKANVETEIRIRERAAAEAERQKAAETLTTEGRKAGISAETVNLIKQKILGVR